jgi:hypothetical protein
MSFVLVFVPVHPPTPPNPHPTHLLRACNVLSMCLLCWGLGWLAFSGFLLSLGLLPHLAEKYCRAIFGSRLASRFCYTNGLASAEFAFWEYVCCLPAALCTHVCTYFCAVYVFLMVRVGFLMAPVGFACMRARFVTKLVE